MLLLLYHCTYILHRSFLVTANLCEYGIIPLLYYFYVQFFFRVHFRFVLNTSTQGTIVQSVRIHVCTQFQRSSVSTVTTMPRTKYDSRRVTRSFRVRLLFFYLSFSPTYIVLLLVCFQSLAPFIFHFSLIRYERTPSIFNRNKSAPSLSNPTSTRAIS